MGCVMNEGGWTVGDTEPPLEGTCLDGIEPVSLVTAVATVAHVRRPDGSVFSRAVVPDPDQVANKGVWTMALQSGDLTMVGRKWKVEIEVEWAAGRFQTFGPEDFPVKAAIA